MTTPAAPIDVCELPIGERPRRHRPVRSPEDDVSRDFLSRMLGVDVRSVKNFVDEGMPKSERGRFPLLGCVQWYLNRERESARANKGLNDLDLARQRKTSAEARIAELRLAETEGTLIPVELHQHRLRERLETVAGNVKSINRYQPLVKAAVTDVDADALLDRMSDEILAELYALKDTID
jgi:phage terminase Nu1 subunit (DNA packaging protein)